MAIISHVDWKRTRSFRKPPRTGPRMHPTDWAHWKMLDALSDISSSDSWWISPPPFLEAPTFLYSSFRRASIRMGIKGTKMKASMAPSMMKPERVR
jgi:hypothetical protein